MTMGKFLRVLGWTILGLFGLVVILGLFGYGYLRTGLPQTDGVITLAGDVLGHKVEIRRDRHGVPHILASSLNDAVFALGFVHAQDRLWQMEMNRRIAAGRLAEVLGKKAVASDIYLRTLSLFDAARQAWAHLDSDTRAMLKSYAAGVNAYIERHHGAWPPEFLITGVRPEPWTPIDSLGWLKVMALDLGGNFRRELARLDLLSVLTPRQVMQFYPPYPGEEPIPLPDINRLYDGLKLADLGIAPGPSAGEKGLGSNNWVVSGTHTRSGLPLLANDPHLRLNTPSIWYLAAIKVGDREVVGASMPGVPFIVLGRTDRIAWGFTNTGPDVQDLYLEKLGEDGISTAAPDGPARLRFRREVIQVKDAEPVEIRVRISRHGPLISDAMPELKARLPKNMALALRWTALDPDDTSAAIGVGFWRAHDFASFRAALHHFVVPEQNMVYADRKGHIGYYAPARVPIRGESNDTHGLIPAPGWKAGYDWQGFIPYDALPTRFDPPEGFIATANEKIVGPDYPYYLTSEWVPPYRGDRIRALLAAQDKHDRRSMARIQADVRSTIADDLLPLFLAHLKPDHAPEIAAAMKAWDREMRIDTPEPLIFTAWHRAVARRLYADELKDKFPRYFGAKVVFLKLVLSGAPGYAAWCDDVTTSDHAESCDEIVTAALDDALALLRTRLGEDWHSWRYGKLHRVIQEHRPFSAVALLRPFFELSGANDGGIMTVDVAPASFARDDLFHQHHGPSYRAIYDLAEPDRSLYVIPTGQSGNPLSGHYRDLFALWRTNRYIEIPVVPPADAVTGTLVLEPVTEN